MKAFIKEMTFKLSRPSSLGQARQGFLLSFPGVAFKTQLTFTQETWTNSRTLPAPQLSPSPAVESPVVARTPSLWDFVILECDLGSCEVEASRRDAWVPPGLVSPAWGLVWEAGRQTAPSAVWGDWAVPQGLRLLCWPYGTVPGTRSKAF